MSSPKRLTPAPNSATYPTLVQLDRRAFLAGAGAVAVATGLSACGGLEGPDSLSGGPVGPADPPDASYAFKDTGGVGMPPHRDAAYVPEDMGGAAPPESQDAGPSSADKPDGGDQPDGSQPEVP